MSSSIVAVADLHVGSNVGLCFPDRSPSGDPGRPTREALFAAWKAGIKRHGSPDVLIVNGDCVDGPDVKGRGIGVWCTDMLEQASQAAELIKMWGAKRVFVVQGSDYHVHSGLPVEELVARECGAEVYPGHEAAEARRCGRHWYIEVGGVTMHVAHRVGVSRVFAYRTTPLSRELLSSRLNDLLRHEVATERARLIIRAHAHYYLWVEHSGTDGVILPCWKALDDWMLARGALDISPDVGYVTMMVDNGRLTHDKWLTPIEEVQTAPYTRVDSGRRRRAK